jgi:hypothetical protein
MNDFKMASNIKLHNFETAVWIFIFLDKKNFYY